MQYSRPTDTAPQVLPSDANDYHLLPPTAKQLHFAREIALRTDAKLPADVQDDRRLLSRWIDAHRERLNRSDQSRLPSSKQVAFAERIARIKRRDVPRECFRDRQMMSKWIDGNL